jgi:rhamnopyranosyl-N-acetylglucosaminyl-diphospho-decaprenol beta-1,3/1,4-galactofuranosyltransferase
LVSVDEERQAMAVVLTHNAPGSLDRCLRAIAAQTTPPQAVMVVDNASNPPVTLEDYAGILPMLSLVRSDVNGGPAGGYALALQKFLESGYRQAWMLDDDMLPAPECLERLWVVAAKKPSNAFVFPVSFQVDGSFGAWPSWCGFLVAREIVEEVGLPMSELFWWAEDTEYLQWRIPEAGYPMRVVGDAFVYHGSIRHGEGVPVWKYYYEARNMLYVHLYVKRRVGRYPRSVSRLVGRAVLREKEGRLVRLRAIVQGLWDGAHRRLGVRYPVEPMREREHGKDRDGSGREAVNGAEGATGTAMAISMPVVLGERHRRRSVTRPMEQSSR